ncbi:MAG TPA: hypothetical protein VNL94_00440 [Candidatus Binatia bacterium]|nr:hypothetical protein [Candidatus Binatia bacterium]
MPRPSLRARPSLRGSPRVASALALGGLLGGLLLAAPATVLADCAPPPSIEEALETHDIVFVGTVEDTAEQNRWAVVTVEEVWRGPDQPRTVVIKGGLGGNMMSSVDRFFEVGERYLFFPSVDPPNGLADNACSSTTQFREDLARLRPADARPPIDEASTAGAGAFDLDALLPFAAVGVVFVILLGVGLLARGRVEA